MEINCRLMTSITNLNCESADLQDRLGMSLTLTSLHVMKPERGAAHRSSGSEQSDGCAQEAVRDPVTLECRHPIRASRSRP